MGKIISGLASLKRTEGQLGGREGLVGRAGLEVVKVWRPEGIAGVGCLFEGN